MTHLPDMFYNIQHYLFPELEEVLGELTAKHKEFIRAIELIDIKRYAISFAWKGVGCKPHDRESIIKSFLAKPIFEFVKTRNLLDNLQNSPILRRLCGWESRNSIPSESTFSRAFNAFSQTDLGDKVHEALIKEHHADKIVGHASKDSTSVASREKACRKNSHGKKIKKKRGRPAKGTIVEKKPRRLELQDKRTLNENLSDLPQCCNWGTKKNSDGKTYTWKGYKAHLDVSDAGVPLSAIVTSASVHDSQVAVPLMQMTKERVINFYDVMDSAYDAPEIHEFSKGLGHVPLIDNNPRRGEKIEFEPAKKIRYNERTSAERANSELKDNYGLENIFVKGYKKAKLHIMFSVVVLTCKTLFNMVI